MFSLARKLSHNNWLAIIWSVLTQILLCLPGSVFPGGGLFEIPYLDKIAHLGLFGGLVFFWSLYFYLKPSHPGISTRIQWLIILLGIAYGILMEFVQLNFIPNRSFDNGDILADIAGSLIGYIITQWFIKWNERKKTTKN